MKDLVQDFLYNHMREHACDHCGRHFPKSALVGFDYPFKGFSGRFCVVCCHKIYDLMDVCCDCGEEYPKSHLYKNLTDQSVVCKNCLRAADEEEEYG